ncbi:hypothetical protein [Amycolatopsis sp. lyj-84]|uniref:hypothetical protein n=1 Tax=Amycolatopsis sp. lyj-84 TaxID=2789284 RepID=UPI00397A4D64
MPSTGDPLESRYGRWSRQVVPQSFFWPVPEGLRNFLITTAHEPALERPRDYPDVRRTTTGKRDTGTGRTSYVDFTCFPPSRTGGEVIRAAEGAWQSPDTTTWRPVNPSSSCQYSLAAASPSC